jgi:signal transduction histidine kinase
VCITGINLAYVLNSGVPKRFKADSVRLQQIIVSLLNYAVKLMTSGEIVITVAACSRSISLSPSLTTLPLLEPSTSEEDREEVESELLSTSEEREERDLHFADERQVGVDLEEREEEKGEEEEMDEGEEVKVEVLEDEVVELHFQVKISGLLISEEECNMLFKPFSSHSAASQLRKIGGAGLGTHTHTCTHAQTRTQRTDSPDSLC